MKSAVFAELQLEVMRCDLLKQGTGLTEDFGLMRRAIVRLYLVEQQLRRLAHEKLVAFLFQLGLSFDALCDCVFKRMIGFGIADVRMRLGALIS